MGTVGTEDTATDIAATNEATTTTVPDTDTATTTVRYTSLTPLFPLTFISVGIEAHTITATTTSRPTATTPTITAIITATLTTDFPIAPPFCLYHPM